MIRTPDWPARRTDPITSHLAAETVEKTGTRSRQQNTVLQLVHRFPGCTSCELAKRSELDGQCPLDRYQIARRLPELEAVDVIRKDTIRKSRVTGNRAITWSPVVSVAAKEPTLF